MNEQEQLNNLAEEVDAIISQNGQMLRESVLIAKREVGEAIVSSPLYKKYSKGAGSLVEHLALKMNKSTADLYFCVRFYEKFPSGIPEELAAAPIHKVKLLLGGGDDLPVEKQPTCRKCKLHCPKDEQHPAET